LILDASSAHRPTVVLEAANLCHIDLLCVPPGCTVRLQYLDQQMLGSMKSSARSAPRSECHRTGAATFTKADLTRRLVAAWDPIRPQVIDSAWRILLDEENWGEEDDTDGDDVEDTADRERINLHDLEDRSNL
jgi:hypothetical protein